MTEFFAHFLKFVLTPPGVIMLTALAIVLAAAIYDLWEPFGRYVCLLVSIVMLAVAAYGVAQFSSAPLAVLNQKVRNHAKMQGRWTGCYMDTRAEVVRCTEE